MYFSKLPEMYYNFPIKDRDTLMVVRDITANVRVVKEVLQNITLYDEYDIVDGETPEIISSKLYGSPLYHWALMVANDKYDYRNDFPLPYDRLEQFAKDKYGEDKIYDIHHYENEEGYVVNSDHPNATPISNLDYEDNVNESKRRIKVVSVQILQQIINEFELLMNPNK